MIDPTIPTEPTIPCKCGRFDAEIEPSQGEHLCVQCAIERWPEKKAAILAAYSGFCEAAYGSTADRN